MEAIKPILDYKICEEKGKGLPVIVVAAGSSTRMKGVNKQLLPLAGIPVIVRTLLALERSPFVSRIILVTRQEDIPEMQRLCEKYMIHKLTDLVKGGNDRHESVLCGFARLSGDENKVLIHDGARPLVTDFVIGNVTAALQNNDAVVCGVKISDTVKRADENGIVTGTVNRDGLYAVQTPQGVSVQAYKAAAEKLNDTACFTDDAAFMEAAGYQVKIVQGSCRNIKITTPEDISLAELYIKGEK